MHTHKLAYILHYTLEFFECGYGSIDKVFV